MSDRLLLGVLAELEVARARVRDLERELTEIAASPTWRLALRLRGAKRRIENSGRVGHAASRLIRTARLMMVHEWPSGVRGRATDEVPPAPEPPAPPAPPEPPPP